MFPNLHRESIKPFEIHVYYGSSFEPKYKWVVKGFEGTYGMFPTRTEAITYALMVARNFVFLQRIFVHSFGSQFPEKCILKLKTNRE